MTEQQIQTLFSKKNTIEGAFELKLCKGKSLRWDAVKDHQIEGLLKISGNGGLFHKISDSPWTQKFTIKKPFDCFYFKNKSAYVVVCFYIPRKKKIAYYIPIHNFLHEKSQSLKKSFDEETAFNICIANIDL